MRDGRRSTQLLSGWGRTAATAATVVAPATGDEARRFLRQGDHVIPRGLGRSYGDTAQSAGGTVLDCTRLDGIRSIDVEAARITVGAGTSLDVLMRTLVPLGLFVPVTPGTRHVTVGGAVASDIHGKNHHHDGSFCSYVETMVLELADGRRLEVAPDDAAFWATAGGLGLTGVVSEATVRMRPVTTSSMVVDTWRARDLEECMADLEASDTGHRYSVAWIDCLARGARLGRSVITCGDHAGVEDLPARRRATALSFDPQSLLAAPPSVPPGLMNRLTIGAFNEVWFRKAPRRRQRGLLSMSSFFHPLDGVRGWNRLYGPRGFLQHQCVVPFGQEAALRTIIERLSASGCASFLAVLKRFGPGNPGPLSFPMPGWTLALDLPIGPPALGPMLDEIDELVVAAGGRVYLAKDARLKPELVPAMYPRLDEWREVQRSLDPEGRLRSDQSRRLQLLP
ncbi:MAG: FAD-binding oxidoreductase [Acidimicrobiales bacterium]